MRILLVKLSSLGDVIHNFPVASDIRRAYPDALIDWVTEAAYAPLVSLHPAISRVFPVHLRALKKVWWRTSNWSRFFADKVPLAAQRYDLIIDAQGLVKSALVARWANGPIAGFDHESVREPYATRWYQNTFNVPAGHHAIERNRTLAAHALGYALPNECNYGLADQWPPNKTAPLSPYVVFLHATSRADKEWPVASWITLGKMLNRQGLAVMLLSGNAAEFQRGKSIAGALSNAIAAPMQSLTETAALLANANAVVGVDTGLAHLAVALGRPTVGIYCATDPAKTGLYGTTRVINLMAPNPEATITPDAVAAALIEVCA
ncbi:MAG: lipopolysaccharide heptosyltransferase I [Pseudomonadota bacterium]